MFSKKNLYKGRSRVVNTFVFAVLLAFGVQVPLVNADETGNQPLDALQLSMSRSQASFDQKMSGVRDGLLQQNIFSAEMILEQTAEFSMHEVELAVGGTTDQQEKSVEAININLPPAKLSVDSRVCFVKNGVREC